MRPAARYSVHLLRTREGREGLTPQVLADRDEGLEVRLVLLHDLADPWAHVGEGYADVVVRLADDLRRRGHPVPAGSLEYGELVDLLAGAARVASW